MTQRVHKCPVKECKKDPRKESSSIIQILKSFGIDLTISLNFLSTENKCKDELILNRMKDHQKRNNSVGLVSDPNYKEETDEDGVYQVLGDGWIVGIRFKCLFNHLSVMNKLKETNDDISEMLAFWGNVDTDRRKVYFDTLLNVERRNCNKMRIDIDLKSLSDIVKYLELNGEKSVEEEILCRVVEIMDVDHAKKQVYIRLKSFIEERPNNLSSYLLMGKIDGSSCCFILNLTTTFEKSRNLITIYKIYEHFTPQPLKSRIYNKNGKPNLFHDCREVGVYRVLIGCFFNCITLDLVGRDMIGSHDVIRRYYNPRILRSNSTDYCGEIIATEMYWTNGYFYGTSHGGIVETGFYSFHLPMSRFYSNMPEMSFFPEIYHFVY